MFRSKSFLALLTVSFFLSSCQLANDMRDNTEQLRDITNNMSQTTTVLERQQRQAVSEQIRTKNLEILQDKDVPFEHRVRSAAIFTKSLEFQVLQNSTESLSPYEELPPNIVTKRDQLLAEGIEEYLLVFRGFLTNGRKQHKRFPKINPFSKDPAHLSALAMALTADQINSEQITAARQIQRAGFQPQSPLSLIMNTLLSQNKIENTSEGMRLNSSPPPHPDPRSTYARAHNAPMPPYMEKVLYFEEESKYLLEARYNMLLGTSMDKLVNARSKSRAGLFGSLLTNNWKADLENLSAPEIHRTNNYIGEAIHLNQAYNSRYRQKPRLFSRILSVVRNLQFTGNYAERFAGFQNKLFAIDQLRYALSFLRGVLNIGKNNPGDDYYGDDNYYNSPYNNPYSRYPQPYYNTGYNNGYNGYNSYNTGGGRSSEWYPDRGQSSELYPNNYNNGYNGYNNGPYNQNNGYNNGPYYQNNGYNNRPYYQNNNGYNNSPYPQQVGSYQTGNRGYDQDYDYGAW